MTQSMLWDLPPNTHADGPATEGMAADIAKATRKRNCELVLALVLRHPHCTPNELWELAHQDEKEILKEVQEIRRRATDLKAVGAVVVSGQRKCSVRGTTMQTLRGTGR